MSLNFAWVQIDRLLPSFRMKPNYTIRNLDESLNAKNYTSKGSPVALNIPTPTLLIGG